VYSGRGRTDSSGFSNFEHSATNAAISATRGHVRRFKSNGAVARTEFSSSTGGQTIGGTFPGVPDAGDRISSNPHHRWTKKIPVSDIQAKYRMGYLLAADVVGTDGWGDNGGRATSVRLRFTNGTTTVSATSFRLAFGLKSNWFRV
jgi:peptidoglycan hydrolase-like amidase